MQRAYRRIIVSVGLMTGLFAGCEEKAVITDLKNEVAELTAERNGMASENDSLKANIDSLRRENEELKKQLAGK
ncbi:MAG: hypothetical protein ACRERD_14055 [Candidatus Binatia bacterium]